MIDKTISIPIYDFLVRVIISDSYEEFEQDVFDAGWEDGCEGAGAIVFHTEGKHYTLVINREDISPGNIAHEAGHIVNSIYHSINAEWDHSNDEPYCYLLGFVVDCIHKIIDDGN